MGTENWNQPPAEAPGNILDSLPDGVFAVDARRRITYLNRSAERLLGVSRVNAVGRPCSSVFRSTLCSQGCALQLAKEQGKSIHRDGTLFDSSGRTIPVHVSTSLLLDATGKVTGAVETFRDTRRVSASDASSSVGAEKSQFIATGEAMSEIVEMLPPLAASEATVLVQGETGTGKEVLARKIHEMSSRGKGPFIAINCAALPDTLLESELFGYKAGAFTGAVKDKPGRFALAEGGTLFLDEIGDISPAVQVRLLRVLQHKEFEPLGATKMCRANVRVIAASNRDLEILVEEGTFRQDLFYRINVVRLDVPALRDRKDEIPDLVAYFVARFNNEQRRSIPGVEPDAMRALVAYDYPGNIRELENVIERAFVLCGNGKISLQNLPQKMRARLHTAEGRVSDLGDAVRKLQAQALLRALSSNDYNREAAARQLGMHKSTFFKKVKALGIVLPDKDGRSNRPARPKFTRRTLKLV